MRRAFARIVIGLVVFAGAAAVGFLLTQRIASDSLRLQAESRLTDLIGSPVTIGDARLTLGFGFRLIGSDVLVWRNEDRAPSLQIDRIRATIRPLSLLVGRPGFSRILFDGVRLRIERSSAGGWTPRPIASLAESTRGARQPENVQSEALLGPLIRVESMMRAILEKSRIADSLEIRNGTVVFIDAQAEHPMAPPLFLAFESVHAKLRRSRLARTSRLVIKARLIDARGDRGRIELEGTRNRHGDIRVAMAVTSLETNALAPYVRSLHPAARIEASVSGAIAFESEEPGSGRLEIDLVGHDVRSVGPGHEAGEIAVERIALGGAIEITPQTVRLRNGHLRGGELELIADGSVARPLQSNSFAQVSLTFREVEVAEVRHLIGWLPDIEREEAEDIVRAVQKGRLHSLRAGGSATLAAWQNFLAGRSRTPPEEFFIDATLSDTEVAVGDDDLIEGLQGRLWWSGEHAEVIDARAMLNGTPLPVLDVTIDGVTNFLAGDPTRRRLQSGGVPLLGLQTLWEWFKPDPDEDRPEVSTALGFTIERLHHPMLLWPIENTSVALWNTEHGLHFDSDNAIWAGVPVSGEAEWTFEPEERVRVAVTASAPDPGPAVASTSNDWVEGSVVIGIQQDGPWKQQHGTARFRARGSRFHFDRIESQLYPAGALAATLMLDAGSADKVPFEVDFAATGAKVEALAEQLGQPKELGSGHVDIGGSFRGSLRPGVPLMEDFTGLLEVVATDGVVRRAVPAVVALALASQAYNPFIRRDEVRYERAETTLEFQDGAMSTTGFFLDGPDLRVFASGTLDVLRPPHLVDAQVALFLFRQIDKVIEKIPIVNRLLLGTNDNLIGAHFKLTGPWEGPDATTVPLSALASGPASIIEQGPASVVLQTLPMFMMKGVEAIESMLRLGNPTATEPSPEVPASAEPDAS
ncbi:MAG: AsmA-like C-terminal domain-containing protein [Deltaproteobacteria bacterium]|nr:AsmA-like C-terminal domain-containing protein [Deltaproteobacteria bacterium]